MIPLSATSPTRPAAAPQAGAAAPVAGDEAADRTTSAHAAPEQRHTTAPRDQRVNALASTPEAAQLRELRARDREVRSHERAHASAAAGLPHGAPSFTFQRGPDGQLYAVGGEVRIDTAPVAGDPQATIDKAEQIQRAALAPAQPSSQDRAVAARAAAMAAQARADLQAERAAAAAEQREAGEAREAGGAEEAAQTHTSCPVCGAKHHGTTHIAGTYGEVAGQAAKNEASPLNLRA